MGLNAGMEASDRSEATSRQPGSARRSRVQDEDGGWIGRSDKPQEEEAAFVGAGRRRTMKQNSEYLPRMP
jgi:hypothetical protein